MNPLLLALTIVGLIGCGGVPAPPEDEGPADLAGAGVGSGGGSDLGQAPGADLKPASGNGDLKPATGGADMATPGTKKAFGTICASDGECASGLCRGFQMMTVFKCTKSCTAANAAAECPNPPSTGQCNGNLVCKF